MGLDGARPSAMTKVPAMTVPPESATGDPPTFSVVVPVYNESGNVAAAHQALDKVSRLHPELCWEFIFVDDGSRDDTFTHLSRLSDADTRVKVVQLSRNYGAHTATAAGLQFASGAAAACVSADLQDHPRELTRLIAKWLEGYEVVWGIRTERADSAIDRVLSRLFALLVRRIALPNFPIQGTGGIWLIDRLVIDAINSFEERHQVVGGLILFCGFRQGTIEYAREKRRSGRSTWSLRRKLSITVDYIVAFSLMPLRLASLSGLLIAVLCFGYMIYQVAYRLLYGTTVPGFTQSIVLLLMLGGLQLLMLGVLGEYLWRAMDDVRRRPLFFVKSLRGEFPHYCPPLPPQHRVALHPAVPDTFGKAYSMRPTPRPSIKPITPIK
jgi:polyisoprenyl-phosphate glycosyltransferase